MSTLAPFPALAALVAQAQADIATFGAACTLTDSVVAEAENRDITDADWAHWEQADQARQASIGSVLDHRPSSAAEAAAKAAAVCGTGFAAEVNEAEWPRVYLADAQHLASLAGGTP